MPITTKRPVEHLGNRLFYRTNYTLLRGKVGGHYNGPLFIPPTNNNEKNPGLFRVLDPDNVIATLRLYKWFSEETDRRMARKEKDFSGSILKDELIDKLFQDWPSINKHRVGRLLRLILPYKASFQLRPTSTYVWRWNHTLDIVFGLEHLMLLWLPRVINATGGICLTDEDFLEELEVLRNQTIEEDRELVSTILKNNLF